MALSPLDPTFHGGRPIFTPTDSTSTTGPDTADAIAALANGQFVVVGQTNTLSQGVSANASVGLAVRRYNADGSLDPTFGIGGEVDFPLLGDKYEFVKPLPQVLVGTDGTITLAANVTSAPGSATGVYGLLVTRLTPTGAVDSSFGTGGEVILPTQVSTSNSFASLTYLTLAQAPGGRIVLAGQDFFGSPGAISNFQPVVTVLDANGSPDPSFHGGQPLVLDAATYGIPGTYESDYLGMVANPAGRIVVAFRPNSDYTGQTTFYDERLVGLQLNGTLDPSFGTGGIVTVPVEPTTVNFSAITVDPRDGSLLLAVSRQGEIGGRLLRFDATGHPDPTFANPQISTPFADLGVDASGRIVVETGGSSSNPLNVYDAIDVQRFLPNGAIDTTFGPDGRVAYGFAPVPGSARTQFNPTQNQAGGISGLAVFPSGQVLVAGSRQAFVDSSTQNFPMLVNSQAVIVQFRVASALYGGNNDYNGDNTSDFAAALTALGAFAVRQSTGGDVVQPFGVPGVGQVLPASGDYDGDGKTDVAAYLPSLGILAYRPSSGGPDQYVHFGPPGVGNAIPVPGDYDGDGKTDVALYLPQSGAFAIDPSSGAAPYAISYGAAGAGQTTPVPADYDGDGTTDLAVYIPALGEFFRRLSTNPSTADTGIAFGPPGVGASIPAPGDYQGLGRAQFAVYIPASGAFAVLDPSLQGYNYAVTFGAAGAGQSIPIPGDYDGDGKDDFAVDLPALGAFAYRPSGGGLDVIQPFGIPGPGQTIPAAAPPATVLPTGVHTMSFAAGGPAEADAAVFVPLVDLGLEPAPAPKKPARS